MSYDKSDSRFSSNGPLSLHKNTPYIYVKHLGHNVKKGDQLVIEKSSNLNRINRSDINKKHIVKVGDTYKIHARVIYPLPRKYYFKMLYDNLDNTGQSFDQNINNSNVINASFKFPSVTNRDSSSLIF